MLGHLSFENLNTDLNGLKHRLTQDQYRNTFNQEPYYPYTITQDVPLRCYIAHEFNYVRTQLKWNGIQNKFFMDGFVEAYATSSNTQPIAEAEPMGFMTSDQVFTSNKEKWEVTVLIVYYDEHGGFFDDVPPPLFPYTETY